MILIGFGTIFFAVVIIRNLHIAKEVLLLDMGYHGFYVV